MMTFRPFRGRFGKTSPVGVSIGILASVTLSGLSWAAWPRSGPLRSDVAAPARSIAGLPIAPTPSIAVPARIGGHTNSHAAPPELDPSLDSLRPVTLTLETTTKVGSRTLKQTKKITRTADRVHVQPEAVQHEWLFIRNPLDPRRVAGVLIEHRRRALVEYDESELRRLGIARGWTDIVTLGIDPDNLRELPASGDEQRWQGLRFVRHSRQTGADGKLQEIWWSESEVLPLRAIQPKQGGISEQKLVALRFEANESVLRDPWLRFPQYATMDVADYREKHHEHGGKHHEHGSDHH